MNQVKVVVVIVTYKTAKLTIESLHSVYKERDYSGIQIQVIVVDNASGDALEIESAVKSQGWESWVTVLTAPKNGGFAYGNNYAFKYALAREKVDFFHLVNPDAQLRHGAIKALVDFFVTQPDAAIAGSSFFNLDGSLWPIAFRFPTVLSELESGIQFGLISKILRRWIVPVAMSQQIQPIDWVAGASMMLRVSAVEKLYGFDESYFLYYEETDLCLRAKKQGLTTWYVPTSQVMHIAGQSTKVTERNAKPKRLPSYLFESRRRYFLVNHGFLYAVLADLIAIIATSLGVAKRFLMNRAEANIPFLITDLIRHSVLFPSNYKPLPFTSALLSVE